MNDLMVDYCEVCHELLHHRVATYSWHVFGKPLCIEHQKQERTKTYKPKLAAFLNQNLKRRIEA